MDLNILTKKEAEVFQYIVAGCTNKEISSMMKISLNTVEYHISNIFDKLDIRDRKKLIVYYKETTVNRD